jgi:hypothetical protein
MFIHLYDKHIFKPWGMKRSCIIIRHINLVFQYVTPIYMYIMIKEIRSVFIWNMLP